MRCEAEGRPPPDYPGASAPAAGARWSLGYEPYDARLRRPCPSPVWLLNLANPGHTASAGPDRLHPVQPVPQRPVYRTRWWPAGSTPASVPLVAARLGRGPRVRAREATRGSGLGLDSADSARSSSSEEDGDPSLEDRCGHLFSAATRSAICPNSPIAIGCRDPLVFVQMWSVSARYRLPRRNYGHLAVPADSLPSGHSVAPELLPTSALDTLLWHAGGTARLGLGGGCTSFVSLEAWLVNYSCGPTRVLWCPCPLGGEGYLIRIVQLRTQERTSWPRNRICQQKLRMHRTP